MDTRLGKQYPSDQSLNCSNEKRLETEARVFRRWLNSHLRQANAEAVDHALDIFRDSEKLFNFTRHLANAKSLHITTSTPHNLPMQRRSSILIERLYGPDLAAALDNSVQDMVDCKVELRHDRPTNWNTRLIDCMDTLWMLIVAVGAGTGPSTTLLGGSMAGSTTSTLTKRSLGSKGADSVSLASSNRTRSLDFWLVNHDERLLAWCQESTDAYERVNVVNFSTSWRDGIAFLAIIHRQKPDLFHFEGRFDRLPMLNLGLAFHLATSEFACPRLLEPFDLQIENIDPRAIATYLIELRTAIERDRRRRTINNFELRTTTMANDNTLADLGINVSVATASNYSSSPATSELNLFSEVDENEENNLRTLATPENFDMVVETTLAWLLTMEEQVLANGGETGSLTPRQGNSPADTSEDELETETVPNNTLLGFREHGLVIDPVRAQEEADLAELRRTPDPESVKAIHQRFDKNVQEAKQRFNAHEDLTAHLSRRQVDVAKCLRLGAILVNKAKEDSNFEVNLEATINRMKVLANRWNLLQKEARRLGKKLANRLLTRQASLIEAIGQSLDSLETEQKRQSSWPFPHTASLLQQRLRDHRNLEVGIEIGEIIVPHIREFIVLVAPPAEHCDRTSAGETKTEQEERLETRVASLAQRWSNLVNRAQTRYADLQNALISLRHFEESAEMLSHWLDQRRDEIQLAFANPTNCNESQTSLHESSGAVNHASLPPFHASSQMTASVMSDKSERPASGFFQRLKQAAFSRNSSTRGSTASIGPAEASNNVPQHNRSNSLGRQSAAGSISHVNAPQKAGSIVLSESDLAAVASCLADHETVWAQMLANLDRQAREVRKYCGETAEVVRAVEKTVDDLVTRWSQLTEPQIDWDSELQDEELAMADILYLPRGRDPSQLSDQGGNSADEAMVKARGIRQLPGVTSSATKTSSSQNKRSKDSVDRRAEFEANVEDLLNWLDQSAVDLEKVTMDRGLVNTLKESKLGNVQSPVDKLNRVVSVKAYWQTETEHIKSLATALKQELSSAGENVEELDQLFEDIDERWTYLDKLIDDANMMVERAGQFQESVDEVFKTFSSHDQSNEIKQACLAIDKELKASYEFLETPIKFRNSEQLEDEVMHLTEMQRDLSNELDHFMEQVNEEPSSKLVSDTTVPRMKERVENGQAALEQRIALLHDLSNKHDNLIKQIESLEKWLREMDDYLESVQKAELSSETVIRAQYKESSEALDDMKFLVTALEKIEEDCNYLLQYLEDEYGQSISNRSQKLRADWMRIKDQTERSLDALSERLEGRSRNSRPSSQTDSSNNDTDNNNNAEAECHSLEAWISRTKLDLKNFVSITSMRQFKEFDTFVKHTLNELQQKKALYQRLQAQGNSQLILSANFTALQSSLEDAAERQQSADYNLTEFQNVLQQEEAAMQKIEMVLQKLSDRPVATELEHLQAVNEDIETRDHDKLRVIRDALAEIDVLPDEMKSQLSSYEDRFSKLRGELTARVATSRTLDMPLELKDLVDAEVWIDEVSRVLKDRLQAGVSAEDHPQEYNQWINHLRGISSFVRDSQHLSSLSDRHKIALDHIKSRILSTRNLLHQYSLPSDFDARVATVETTLGELESQAEKLTSQIVDLTELEKIEVEMEKNRDNCQVLRMEIDALQMIEQSKETLEAFVDSQDKLALQQSLRLRKRFSLVQDKLTHSHDKLHKLTNCLRDIESHCAKLSETQEEYDDLSEALEGHDILQKKERLKPFFEKLRTLAGEPDSKSGRFVVSSSAMGRCEHRIFEFKELSKGMLVDQRLSENMQEISDCLIKLEAAHEALYHLLTNDKAANDLQKDETFENFVFRFIANAKEASRAAQQKYQNYYNNCPLRNSLSSYPAEEPTTDVKEQPVSEMDGSRLSAYSDSSVGTLTEGNLVSSLLHRAQLVGNPSNPSSQSDINGTPMSVSHAAAAALAAEMYAHFNSILLFHGHCLRSDRSPAKAKAESDNRFETSVTDCQQKVKIFFDFESGLFMQQNTYLDNRLVTLKDEMHDGDALREWTAINTFWREANEKLKLRTDRMKRLDHELFEVAEAIVLYERNRNSGQREKCLELLRNLSSKYCWNLSADFARLKVKDAGLTSDRPASVSSNDSNLTNYKESLQLMAKQLNVIQLELDSCRNGQIKLLDERITTLEHEFVLCRHSLSRAQQAFLLLDEARCSATSKDQPAELTWLSSLLQTQKTRLTSYHNDFTRNKMVWNACTSKWNTFWALMKSRRKLVDRLHEEPTDMSIEQQRDQFGKLCIENQQLVEVGDELCSLLNQSVACTEENGSAPKVPPRQKTSSGVQSSHSAVEDTVSEALNGSLQSLSSLHSGLSSNTLLNSTTFSEQHSRKLARPPLSRDLVQSEGNSVKKAITEFTGRLISLGNRLGCGPDLPGPVTRSNEYSIPPQDSFEELLNVESADDHLALDNRLQDEVYWLSTTAKLIATPEQAVSSAELAAQNDALDKIFLQTEPSSKANTVGPRGISDTWFPEKQEQLNTLQARLKEHEQRSQLLMSTCERMQAGGRLEPDVARRLEVRVGLVQEALVRAQETIDRRQNKLRKLRECFGVTEQVLLLNVYGDLKSTVPLHKQLAELNAADANKGTTDIGLLDTRNRMVEPGSVLQDSIASLRLAWQQIEQFGLVELLSENMVDAVHKSLAEFDKLLQKPVHVKMSQNVKSEMVTHAKPWAKLREEIKQILKWLSQISSFLQSGRITLGDHFDQESMRTNLQQYAIELEAKEPQLERLRVERNHLQEQPDPIDQSTVDELDMVHENWLSIRKQVESRLHDLDAIISQTQNVQEVERDLDRWIKQTESEADQLPSTAFAQDRRRHVQQLVMRLPKGEALFAEFQNMCEALTQKFSSEDTTRLQLNQEQSRIRFSSICKRLRELDGEAKQPGEQQGVAAFAENATDLDRLDDRCTQLLSIANQLYQNSLVRSSATGKAHDQDLRTRLMGSLQELQNDLEHAQVRFTDSGSVQSVASLGQRMRISRLQDRSVEIKRLLQLSGGSMSGSSGGQDNPSLFLAHVRELIDWVAHRNAAFREQRAPIGGDRITITRQLNEHKALMAEVNDQYQRVQDTLHHGIAFGADLSREDRLFVQESEAESDGSEFDAQLSTANEVESDRSKRITRRIKRNLIHLKRRYENLVRDIADHERTLIQQVTQFESSLVQVSNQVIAAENVVAKWDPLDKLSTRQINEFIRGVRTFQDSCQNCFYALTELRDQATELESAKIQLSMNLRSRFEDLQHRFARVKAETKNRIAKSRDLLSLNEIDSHPSGFFHEPIGLPTRPQIENSDTIIANSHRDFFRNSVQSPWERCLHPSGSNVPYYKNHQTQETQWDHPKLLEFTESLNELDIRYISYRTAIILRKLQQFLCLDLADKAMLTTTFALPSLQVSVGVSALDERLLNVNQVVECLKLLYTRILQKADAMNPNRGNSRDAESSAWPKSGLGHTESVTNCTGKSDADFDPALSRGCTGGVFRKRKPSGAKQRPTLDDLDSRSKPSSRGRNAVVLPDGRQVEAAQLVDYALNWLLNTFDGPRNGKIRVVSLKLGLIILSNMNLEDKCRSMFGLVATRTGMVDQRRLGLLVTECLQVPKCMSSGNQFGSKNLETVLRTCFRSNLSRSFQADLVDGSGRIQRADADANGLLECISQDHFVNWVKSDPAPLVWLVVMHKFIDTSSVLHQVKCSVCQTHPIIGLRYRCLRCLNFDMCQRCFLTGKVAKTHKLTHPVQEHNRNLTSSENIRDYSRIVRNRLRSKNSFRKSVRKGSEKCAAASPESSPTARANHAPISSSLGQGPKPNAIENLARSTPNSSCGNDLISRSVNQELHEDLGRFASRLAMVEDGRVSAMGMPREETLSRVPARRAASAMARPLQSTPTHDRTDEFRIPFVADSSAASAKFDEEHQLIANFSETLRRQSFPEIQVGGQSGAHFSSMTSSMGPFSTQEVGVSGPTAAAAAAYTSYAVSFASRAQSQPPVQRGLFQATSTRGVDPVDFYGQEVIASLPRPMAALATQYPARGSLDHVAHAMDETRQMQAEREVARMQYGAYACDPYTRRALQPMIPATPQSTHIARYGAGIGSQYGTNSLDRRAGAAIAAENDLSLQSRIAQLEQQNMMLESKIAFLSTQDRPSPFMHPGTMDNSSAGDLYTSAQYAASRQPALSQSRADFTLYNSNPNSLNLFGAGQHYDYVNDAKPSSKSAYNPRMRYHSGNDPFLTGLSYQPMRSRVDQVSRGPTAISKADSSATVVPSSIGQRSSSLSRPDPSALDTYPRMGVTAGLAQGHDGLSSGTNNLGNLIEMAGQVGRAVGQLVHVMTDEDQEQSAGGMVRVPVSSELGGGARTQKIYLS